MSLQIYHEALTREHAMLAHDVNQTCHVVIHVSKLTYKVMDGISWLVNKRERLVLHSTYKKEEVAFFLVRKRAPRLPTTFLNQSVLKATEIALIIL